MSKKERTIYPLESVDQDVDPKDLGILVYHIVKQQDDLKRGNFIPPDIESRKKILSWYQGTNHFRKIYDKAIKFFSSYHANVDIDNFKGEITGSMFEFIAHSYLSGRSEEGQIVLSPNRTHDVIKATLSVANLEEATYDQASLEKVKIPDGLVIDTDTRKVINVCEYTVKRKKSKIIKHLRAVHYLGRRESKLFGESQALFILPGPDSAFLNKLGGSVMYLPFNRSQFEDFINKVIYNFRGIPSFEKDDFPLTEMNATLFDIQSRIREQKKLGLKYAEFTGEKMPFNEFVELLESEKNFSELFD